MAISFTLALNSLTFLFHSFVGPLKLSFAIYKSFTHCCSHSIIVFLYLSFCWWCFLGHEKIERCVCFPNEGARTEKLMLFILAIGWGYISPCVCVCLSFETLSNDALGFSSHEPSVSVVDLILKGRFTL